MNNKESLVQGLASLGAEGKIPVDVQESISYLIQSLIQVDESVINGEFGIYSNDNMMNANKRQKVINFVARNAPVTRADVIQAIIRVISERKQKSNAAKARWRNVGKKIITQMRVSNAFKSAGENQTKFLQAKSLNKAILAVTLHVTEK